MTFSAAVSEGSQARDPELTAAVLAERRMRTLAGLVRGLRGPAARLAEVTAEVLAGNLDDHPAGAVYAVTPAGPQLLAGFGELPAEAVDVLAAAASGEPVYDPAARLHAPSRTPTAGLRPTCCCSPTPRIGPLMLPSPITSTSSRGRSRPRC
jgi:hypothetical protein